MQDSEEKISATGKRRLLKLADLLATKVPPQRFDLENWTSGNSGDPRDCGTAGCAVGWATTIPSFKRAGLRVVYRPNIKVSTLHYAGWDDWSAVSIFFGLSADDANHLFAAEAYDGLPSTPKAVAKRIRALVKRAS